MAKFSYKKYAKEVVEKLCDVDDVEIYDKFIKEFERLIKQEQYKKELKKHCGTCYYFTGNEKYERSYCEVKNETVSVDDICGEYDTPASVQKKWEQLVKDVKSGKVKWNR